MKFVISEKKYFAHFLFTIVRRFSDAVKHVQS